MLAEGLRYQVDGMSGVLTSMQSQWCPRHAQGMLWACAPATWPTISGHMQVGMESLNMRQAMKIMKEQAAAMAVQAQQQAQEAAAQKADAEASLDSANADLAQERTKFADLQVPHMGLSMRCDKSVSTEGRLSPISCPPGMTA